jgi:hypothetical protein
LYLDSNRSGMALVFGCLVGLTAIRPRWREIFLLLTFAGDDLCRSLTLGE